MSIIVFLLETVDTVALKTDFEPFNSAQCNQFSTLVTVTLTDKNFFLFFVTRDYYIAPSHFFWYISTAIEKCNRREEMMHRIEYRISLVCARLKQNLTPKTGLDRAAKMKLSGAVVAKAGTMSSLLVTAMV